MKFEDQEVLTLVQSFEAQHTNGERGYFDVEEYEMIIDYYRDTASFKWMRRAVEQGRAVHPKAIELQIKAVHLAIALKKYDEAADLLEHIAAMSPTHPDLLIARATLLLHQGHTSLGLELLERALEHAEEPLDVLHQIAEVHLDLGQYSRAIDALLRLLNEDPEGYDEAVLFQLASCLEYTGENERGRKLYLEFAEKEPYQPLTWYHAGTFCMRLERDEEAKQMLEWATVADEEFYAGYIELGRIYEREERFQDAIDSYLKGTASVVESNFLHYRIALLYGELELPEKALEHLNKAVEIEPEMEDVYLERANVYMELEQYELAVADFTRVWLEEAYDGEDVLDFADCLMHIDRIDEAMSVLRDGCKRFPKNSAVLVVAVGYLFALEEFQEAETLLLKYHKKKNQDAVALLKEFFPTQLENEAVANILAVLGRKD